MRADGLRSGALKVCSHCGVSNTDQRVIEGRRDARCELLCGWIKWIVAILCLEPPNRKQQGKRHQDNVDNAAPIGTDQR